MIGKTISHYRILEKLGEGGMGAVYKAEDTKLKRTVALKFLPPDLTSDLEARERFLQEAQAASALDHPNICTVHEIDTTVDGRMFIVMAYCEGETLRDRIKRGPLEEKQALRIAVQVAEGLERAHEAGIVHRDIKPANIMITRRGEAKVVDFGLAKLTGQTRLTRTGSTAGTVAYMSPEQVRGEDTDTRSDIWSLGVVLYEMLTGVLPFRGDHEAALLYSIAHEELQPAALVRPGIRETVSAVVARALQKDRARRHQTTREFIRDLTALTEEIAAGSARPADRDTSIAVLPFENLSPDPDQEYFSDGLTEEVISDLSNVQSLRVISRSSAMTFKGTRKTVPEIARQLGVRHVLEGSVRKAGSSIRVTAQLIDAATDTHIWAEKYAGSLDDVFDVQESISRAIVTALKLKLTAKESHRMAERPIDNVAAYQCYLRASAEIWRFTKNSVDRALEHLQEALGILGDNALLYSAMAFAHWQYANMGVGQEEDIVRAEEYAGKALALAPDSPEAHFVVGAIDMAFKGKSRNAAHELKMALARDPNHTLALILLAGLFTVNLGKPAMALPLLERFKSINPLDPWNYWLKGRLLYVDGQYALAAEQLRRQHEIDPDNPMLRFFYAWTLTYAGKIDEALSIIDEGAGVSPDNVGTKFGLLLKYGLLKDRARALREMTADFRKTCSRDTQWSYFVAVPLALLGEKDEALDWLENAVSGSFINYPELARNPHLASLRGEKRFQELMDKVKYEWEHFEG